MDHPFIGGDVMNWSYLTAFVSLPVRQSFTSEKMRNVMDIDVVALFWHKLPQALLDRALKELIKLYNM